METESKLDWHEKGYLISLFLGSQGAAYFSEGEFEKGAARCGIGLGLGLLGYGYNKFQKKYEHR